MKQSKTKIRDIRILFEHEEEDYYKPVRISNFWSNNYLSMKVTVKEINYNQLKNILLNLDYTQKISQMISKNLIYKKSN